MLSDAGAPAVLAGAPDEVMLADAGGRHSCILNTDTCTHTHAPPASPGSSASAACCPAVLPSARSSRHSRHMPRCFPCPHLNRSPRLRHWPRPRHHSRLFATRTGTARPRQDPALPRPRRRYRDGVCEARRWLRALRAPWRPAPGSAQAGWKGPQVHWAQQRAGVRSTDSPHTGQVRVRSRSAALPGERVADAGVAFWILAHDSRKTAVVAVAVAVMYT